MVLVGVGVAAGAVATAHPPVIAIFAVVSFSELSGLYYGVNSGDYDFDPLSISSGNGPVPPSLPNVGKPFELATAELKNGRLAMLAVTGYAAQEFVLGSPVVEQTPIFF